MFSYRAGTFRSPPGTHWLRERWPASLKRRGKQQGQHRESHLPYADLCEESVLQDVSQIPLFPRRGRSPCLDGSYDK